MRVGEYKSPSGLIRAEVEVKGDLILDVTFTGDFFVYPESKLSDLENQLKETKRDDASRKIEDFYGEEDIKSPSLEPEHWWKAIEKALEAEDE